MPVLLVMIVRKEARRQGRVVEAGLVIHEWKRITVVRVMALRHHYGRGSTARAGGLVLRLPGLPLPPPLPVSVELLLSLLLLLELSRLLPRYMLDAITTTTTEMDACVCRTFFAGRRLKVLFHAACSLAAECNETMTGSLSHDRSSIICVL